MSKEDYLQSLIIKEIGVYSQTEDIIIHHPLQSEIYYSNNKESRQIRIK